MKPKILLVDDSELTREYFKELLSIKASRNDEFIFMEAEDGEEALRKIEADKPDIIFIDIEMPKIDGIELCKRLKSTPEYSNIKIIFSSVNNNEKTIEKCISVGGDLFFQNPLTNIEENAILAYIKGYIKYNEKQKLYSSDNNLNKKTPNFKNIKPFLDEEEKEKIENAVLSSLTSFINNLDEKTIKKIKKIF